MDLLPEIPVQFKDFVTRTGIEAIPNAWSDLCCQYAKPGFSDSSHSCKPRKFKFRKKNHIPQNSNNNSREIGGIGTLTGFISSSFLGDYISKW